jgi:hypothetical protein
LIGLKLDKQFPTRFLTGEQKKYGEKTRTQTPARRALAALDKFSASFPDDLERAADLLGEPGL